MSPHRPYHHGNLRRSLLDRAAVVLRERGAAALSLRELSRDIGVSHAAPGRHFSGRQALLDALVVEGFARLGTRLQDAVDAQCRLDDQVRSMAGAYVDFATSEANLLELLFAHNKGVCADTLEQGAVDAFAPALEMFRRGQTDGALRAGDPVRLGLMFIATFQGVAAMVNGGIIRAEHLEHLIDDAVAHFLRGARASP